MENLTASDFPKGHEYLDVQAGHVTEPDVPFVTRLRKGMRKVINRISGPVVARSTWSTYDLDPVMRNMEEGIHSNLEDGEGLLKKGNRDARLNKSHKGQEHDARTVSKDAELLQQWLTGQAPQPAPLPVPYNAAKFYDFYDKNWPCRMVTQAIVDEVFRQEIVVKPNFAAICPKCKTEFENDVPVVKVSRNVPKMGSANGQQVQVGTDVVQEEHRACPECYKDENVIVKVRTPDKAQKTRAQDWLNRVARDGKSMSDMMQVLEEDDHIVDIDWTLFSKRYVMFPGAMELGTQVRYVLDTDRNNKDIHEEWRDDPYESEESCLPKVVEMTRGNPQVLRFVVDERDRLGGRFYTCVIHRQVLYDLWKPSAYDRDWSPRDGYQVTGGDYKDAWARIPPHQNPKMKEVIDQGCPTCKARLEEVQILEVSLESKNRYESPVRGYIAGEWVVGNHYSKSRRYGMPLIFSLWRPFNIIRSGDLMIDKLFRDGMPPKGILFIPTQNRGSIRAWFKKEWDPARTDKTRIPTMTYDPAEGDHEPSYINITPTMDELKFTDIIQFYLDKIGAVSGVSPILMNDTSVGGGLNNEGMQLYVTLRKIDRSHSKWHSSWFPKVQYQLFLTDWHYEFPKSKEEDKVAKLERRRMNIELLLQVGAILADDSKIWIDDQEDWSIKWRGEIDLKKLQQQGGGAQGPGGGSFEGGTSSDLMGGMKRGGQQLAGTAPRPSKGAMDKAGRTMVRGSAVLTAMKKRGE